MDAQHLPETVIAQRYRILNVLGQGGIGITYAAEDLQNGQHVVLKTLSLRRMTDWKALELFEREARILESLNHPSIPRYLDYFQVDASEDRSFYLVQQLAPGRSLAALVEDGWHPDEAEVQQLAIQILEILIYLQRLTPPVIHRDIKPQNIILSATSGKDREICIFLVDFGAVQDTYRHTVMGGSTVVGTYGYMAPEQFRGEAFLSTDLYGLGTTLLFLLTGKSPAELPQRKLKIDFRSHIHISQSFANWLEKLLEPVVEDRFQNAADVLVILRGERVFTDFIKTPKKPQNTLSSVTKNKHKLILEIPPVWFRNTYSILFSVVPFLPIFVFIALLSLLIFLGNEYQFSIKFLMFFFSFAALSCCSGLLKPVFFFRSLMCVRLEFEREVCSLKCYQSSHVLGNNIMQGNTQDFHKVQLSQLHLPFAREPFTFCVLRLKRRKFRFGLFLTRQENEWLAGEINGFLEEMQSRSEQTRSDEELRKCAEDW